MLIRIIGHQGQASLSQRNTSYLIDRKLLLDAGSVAAGLRIEEQAQVNHILITHAHLDHVCDLGFICDNCFGMKGKPFEVHSTKIVQDAILTHLMNDIIWPDFSKLPSKAKPTIHFNHILPEKSIDLDEYHVTAIPVNHPAGGLGFIIEKKNFRSILFTGDTGPTDRIWEYAARYKNLKGIFTTVPYPESEAKRAHAESLYCTKSFKEEMKKMPEGIPLFIGQIKDEFRAIVEKELAEVNQNHRITFLGPSNTSYVFAN